MPTAAEATRPPISATNGPNCHQQHNLQAGKRAHHEDLAMGEVQKPQDAKDQRVADCDERVGAAEHHSVGELLRQASNAYLLRPELRLSPIWPQRNWPFHDQHGRNARAITVLVDAGCAHQRSIERPSCSPSSREA